MKWWMNRFDTGVQSINTTINNAGSDRPEQNVSPKVHQGALDQDAYIDYRKLHYKNTIPDNRVLVFLTGFCVGMVFFYLTGGQNIGAESLLNSEHLALMQDYEVNRLGLFEYVAGVRLRQFLFCVICALSSVGGLMAYTIMGWCGFEMGLIIFTIVYQHGVKGILLTFSMILPQGIFYCILFLIIFRRYWTGDKKCCHKEVTVKSERKRQRMDRIKTVVLGILMFCAGILCEVYINPEIMRKITLLFN